MAMDLRDMRLIGSGLEFLGVGNESIVNPDGSFTP